MFGTTVAHLMMFLLVFFLVVNTVRALLLLCAIPELWSHWYLSDDDYFRTLIGTDALPSVSIVATAYNDGGRVAQWTQALLALDYPRYEVVLVNDDSTDNTLEVLIQAFGLTQVSPAFTVSMPTQPVRGYYRSPTYPRLLVIDKKHGGSADALNAGLNAARYPLALMTAANIVVETDALLRLTRPFLLNKLVSAVATPLRIANGGRLVNGRFVPVVPEQPLMGMQMVEMLRTGVFERLGWNRLASNLLFAGSALLVPREHLLAIRGFRTDAESPGADLVVRLQRYLTDRGVNADMLVIPDAVVWTELRRRNFQDALRGTRQYGICQILVDHRGVCLNPEYGAFAMIALPYYWVVTILSPFLELLGYVGLIIGIVLGVLPGGFVWAYLAALLGYGMLLSVWTVILESLVDARYARRVDFVRLLLYAIAEPFGYRQMTAWLRVRAYFTHRLPRRPYEHHTPQRSA